MFYWGLSGIFVNTLHRIDPEEDGQGEDHQFRVEQDEDSGVVEAPAAAQAAGSVDHTPGGGEYGEELPGGGVKMAAVRKAGEAHAGQEGSDREQDSARERAAAEPEAAEQNVEWPGARHTATL